MTWLMIGLLGAATFAFMALVLKAPRPGWEAAGAALMLGAAGFAWQTNPKLPGAPKTASAQGRSSGADLVEARKALSSSGARSANQWSIIADGLARNGNYGDAAGVLVAAVEKDPRNADAWLAMANDLVAHADGVLTPAAQFAFAKAAAADPANPGPDYFEGLALATNGQLDEGRLRWSRLLARSPASAPWRADLEQRLARLDAFIAARDSGQLTQ
ncbi:tetratricopeptide repeat protein [Novosphingobium sp.]|uniref:tetratricopeptide repeat protein n=1 Tax=Novosphingobium sp. TaxID=1874826 RepID=UPI0025D9EE17|nr:tetratricopeptide repeat protein [Novosphingobium sp.]